MEEMVRMKKQNNILDMGRWIDDLYGLKRAMQHTKRGIQEMKAFVEEFVREFKVERSSNTSK